MQASKKRTNFTTPEKEQLLFLTGKYKNIIENKSTERIFVEKENQIWEKIEEEFNCSAESGPTTAKQLKVLYDNLKRETGKSVAKEHHEAYAQKLVEAKKAASADKTKIRKTGGGTFVPLLDNEQEILLAQIREQVRPLENAFNSAAVYFSEDVAPSLHVVMLPLSPSNSIKNIPEQMDIPIIKTAEPIVRDQPSTSTHRQHIRKRKNKKISTEDLN